MQDFEAKKKNNPRICFPYPSVLRIFPFHSFAPLAGIEPGCDGWQLGAITITLRSLHQLIDKMLYLNQMYEKGNVSIREGKKIPRMFNSPSHFE